METLLPLLGFAVATSVTPGPNVLMVAASAANNGVRATVPHMAGITIGFAVMLLLVGLGLAAPFAAWPALHTLLKWGGGAWLLVLAWKIARAGAPGEGPSRPPLGFLGAALFQWVNPKAWAMALGALSAYEAGVGGPLVVASVFAVVNLPVVAAWAAAGQGLRGLLADPARLRVFNAAMATLLVLSMLPVIL